MQRGAQERDETQAAAAFERLARTTALLRERAFAERARDARARSSWFGRVRADELRSTAARLACSLALAARRAGPNANATRRVFDALRAWLAEPTFSGNSVMPCVFVTSDELDAAVAFADDGHGRSLA